MGFVTDIVGEITGSKAAAEAAGAASGAQVAMGEKGIAEQRRQFDAMMQLMAPYVTAGTGALKGMQDLSGLSGVEAQRAAIAGLEGSPQFQALTQQGENAMLQQAAATGGLRGGNIQGALAQFRPQMLSNLIEQQYARLGGIAGMGQASAAGQSAQGAQYAGNIANLMQQQGAAQAGGIMAQGGARRAAFGDLVQLAGAAGGLKAAFSDIRLKKNIKRIGEHIKGIGIYSWEYIWGTKAIGVMVHEVEKIIPEAVSVHPSGFKMVDYSIVRAYGTH